MDPEIYDALKVDSFMTSKCFEFNRSFRETRDGSLSVVRESKGKKSIQKEKDP